MELTSDKHQKQETVHIVGGGLVGTLAAIALAQQNINVILYERREDMRIHHEKAGRTVNLTLTSRGLQALNKVGLAEEVIKKIVPMGGRMTHDKKGNTNFVPYSNNSEETNNSISRPDLNKLLLDKAEELGVTILFNHKCTHYNHETRELTFNDSKTITANIVIGADGGGRSAVMHKALETKVANNYSRQTLDYGYKELSFPAGNDGEFLMDKNSLHIWAQGDNMLIALPNTDGSFTGTLFLRNTDKINFKTLTKDNIEAYFTRYFPDALELMPNLVEEYTNNPVGSMHTVNCKTWCLDDKLLLIGDAAHAVVPFHGQGMNAGFEDTVALSEAVQRHKNAAGSVSWEKVFFDFERERQPNTDALAIMSIDNLEDMLRTATPLALLKKNIGMVLETMSEKNGPLKDRFLAHYTAITFRPEIPYATVLKRDQIKDGILKELAQDVNPVDAKDWRKQVDWKKATNLIIERLTPLTNNIRGIEAGGSYIQQSQSNLGTGKGYS